MERGEWDRALVLRGLFELPDGARHSFALSLMADDEFLYVGAAVEAASLDPEGEWYPDQLNLFFSTLPEPPRGSGDWKTLSNLREQGSWLDDGYWNGRDWVGQEELSGPTEFNGGEPTGRGSWARGGYNATHVIWEAALTLDSSLPQWDEVPDRDVEQFALCVVFSRMRPGEHSNFGALRDEWPAAGSNAEICGEGSDWLSLQLESA